MDDNQSLRMGYLRDLADVRDMDASSAPVKEILKNSRRLKSAAKSAPAAIDLRAWCSPIEDQKSIGSCTAHAGVGMLEYYERRAFGSHIDASRLFLYKVTRNLLGWKGDTGGYLRTTMKALAMTGVPPEQYWPYHTSKFDEEPSAFLYALGDNYEALKYYRLDPSGTPPAEVLANVKAKLAANLPSMFGFTVYNSIPPLGEGTGEIPFPESGDKVAGGHAVLAVGYDDARKIGKCKGALLIRNSWGVNWGEAGYGWLPYDYVLRGLANDFWAMVRTRYVDSALFD